MRQIDRLIRGRDHIDASIWRDGWSASGTGASWSYATGSSGSALWALGVWAFRTTSL